MRVIGVPPNLTDEEGIRTLFESCVGRVFLIHEVEETDGMLFIKLEVGHVLGGEPWEHAIWLEPEYLEPAAKGRGSAEPETK